MPTAAEYIAALHAVADRGDDEELRRCIIDEVPASVRHRVAQYLHSQLKRPKLATTDKLTDALIYYRAQFRRHAPRGEAVAAREAFAATKAKFNISDTTLDRLIGGATKHVNDELKRRQRRGIC